MLALLSLDGGDDEFLLDGCKTPDTAKSKLGLDRSPKVVDMNQEVPEPGAAVNDSKSEEMESRYLK